MKHLVPRQSERRRFLGDLVLRPIPGDKELAVSAINVNQGGLALFSKQALAVGQSVELSPKDEGPAPLSQVVKVLGRVSYVSVQTEGNIMGITFARPLTAGELRTLETKCRIGEQ